MASPSVHLPLLFDGKFSLDNPLPDLSFLDNIDLDDMELVFAAFQANTLYQNAKILAKEQEQRLSIQYDTEHGVLRMWLDGVLLVKLQLFQERFEAL